MGRRSRRRRGFRRNPGLKIGRGFDLQTTLVVVAGAAAARWISGQVSERVTAASDPKVRALITLAAGVGLGMVPGIPPAMRRNLSLGGQVAGAQQLLAEFMPGTFGALVESEDVNVFSAARLPMALPDRGPTNVEQLFPTLGAAEDEEEGAIAFI